MAAEALSGLCWHRMGREEGSRQGSFSPATFLFSGKNIFPRITRHPQTNHWQKGVTAIFYLNQVLLGFCCLLPPLLSFLSMSTALACSPQSAISVILYSLGFSLKSRECSLPFKLHSVSWTKNRLCVPQSYRLLLFLGKTKPKNHLQVPLPLPFSPEPDPRARGDFAHTPSLSPADIRKCLETCLVVAAA